MGRIIGIDLGTTNSLAAVWKDGMPTLIPNALGGFLTPSIVSFDRDGTVYVGDMAKQRQVTHPDDTAAVFKRFMGTDRKITLAGRDYRPEELSALVLKKLKEDAENFLGEPVEEAVVSVPAYFDDCARNATRNAGKLAGFRVERIINEPSAAALAYQRNANQEEATLLVFDFGGGTLDVSVVDCFDNIVEILAVSGDNHLGGSDFDEAILREFCRKNEIDENSLSGEQRGILLQSAVKLKESLTDRERGVMHTCIDGRNLKMELNRKGLIGISESLFARMSVPVRKAMTDAHVGIEGITDVVLVGGSCKMHVVQKFIQHFLGRNQIRVVDPDHMIALGVGVYAGIKERDEDIRDMLLTDICSFSLGTDVYNPADPGRPIMEVLIERNTALPASREKTFCTAADHQRRMLLPVYQGEGYYSEENMLLGSLSVPVPSGPKGKEAVRVRFTYDINGLLVVDAEVVSTGEKRQLVITNKNIVMDEKEIKKRTAALNKLKVHPRDKEENQILLERANRLYAQTTGEMREILSRRASYFGYLLGKQDEFRICRWRKSFESFLDFVEESVMEYELSDETIEAFEAWYDESMDEESKEEEELFDDWESGT